MNTLTKSEIFLKNLLAVFLVCAGSAHFVIRDEFISLVPMWLPVDSESVVFISGVIEIVLGMLLITWRRKTVALGWIIAAYFALIFPGNITQYVQQSDALGLNTDERRMMRLFFQPIFIAWAVWSTGAWDNLIHKQGHWHEKEYDERVRKINKNKSSDEVKAS